MNGWRRVDSHGNETSCTNEIDGWSGGGKACKDWRLSWGLTVIFGVRGLGDFCGVKAEAHEPQYLGATIHIVEKFVEACIQTIPRN